jgi:hypothetical protein
MERTNPWENLYWLVRSFTYQFDKYVGRASKWAGATR